MMKTTKIFILIALMIFGSAETFSQWIEQNTNVTVKLNHCRVFSSNITWVCGDNGTVLRSTNNGTNWISLTGNGIPLNVNLICIAGLNDNAVIIGGNNGSGAVVYMSSNSGANWFQTFSQPGGTLRSLSSHIYLGDPVGGRWSIWKTTNYGMTWDSAGMYLQQAGNEHGWNNSYYTSGSDYTFAFGTNNYRVYKCQNYNWSIMPVAEESIYSLQWDSQNSGYIGGSNLLKTTDFGATWQPENIPGTGNIKSIIIQPGLITAWVTRGNNEIYTKPYDQPWSHSYSSSGGNFVFLKIGVNLTSLFALKDNGGISYKQIPPPPLGINNISAIADRFTLSQNYPNPFNPSTNIGFRISDFGLVRITVFDILGKEVQTLVNQELAPGTYEIDFDGSNLPSGVYYYKLESGSLTETKRMVLIK